MNLENEIRRLAGTRLDLPIFRRRAGVSQLVSQLVQAEILSSDAASLIGEVYAICSPAVHGEKTSEQQLNFVRKVMPSLMRTLREL